MNEQIEKALNERYATKVFDKSKKISDSDLHTILESARLAPSSFGLEPWKFLVVNNEELRAKLQEVSWGQTKVTEASHLVVIAYRTDVVENICREKIERTAKTQNQNPNELGDLKNMIEGTIAKRAQDGTIMSWTMAQSYIPLGMMMETAALLGIDSCPMEGFLPDKVDEILGLKERNLKTATILPLGYRGDDPMAKYPKTSRGFNEVVEFI